MLKKISIISLAFLGSLAGFAQAEQNEQNEVIKLYTARYCYYANKEFAPGEIHQSTPDILQVCSRVNGQLIWLTVNDKSSVLSIR